MAQKPLATVLWQRQDVAGVEYFRLWMDRDGPRLEGSVIAIDEGVPLKLDYDVACSPAWEARTVDLTLTVAGTTRVRRLAAQDAGFAGLAGCVDVDISITPSTNTLPIRRLGLLDLAVGEWRDVTAAWVRFPELSVEPLPQRYTRLAARRFRYESGGGTFRADLEVDDLGLVVSYPPFWRRATTTST